MGSINGLSVPLRASFQGPSQGSIGVCCFNLGPKP